MEHVVVLVSIAHGRVGDLHIRLTHTPANGGSPVTSDLAMNRPDENEQLVDQGWKFLTLKHWAADPRGVWTLSLQDSAGNGLGGTLSSWNLILHGAATDPRVDSSCSAAARAAARDVVQGVGRDQSRPACGNPPLQDKSHSECPRQCERIWLGDGQCDQACFLAACSFDLGDCDHMCGSSWDAMCDGGCALPNGQRCQANWNAQIGCASGCRGHCEEEGRGGGGRAQESGISSKRTVEGTHHDTDEDEGSSSLWAALAVVAIIVGAAYGKLSERSKNTQATTLTVDQPFSPAEMKLSIAVLLCCAMVCTVRAAPEMSDSVEVTRKEVQLLEPQQIRLGKEEEQAKEAALPDRKIAQLKRSKDGTTEVDQEQECVDEVAFLHDKIAQLEQKHFQEILLLEQKHTEEISLLRKRCADECSSFEKEHAEEVALIHEQLASPELRHAQEISTHREEPAPKQKATRPRDVMFQNREHKFTEEPGASRAGPVDGDSGGQLWRFPPAKRRLGSTKRALFPIASSDDNRVLTLAPAVRRLEHADHVLPCEAEQRGWLEALYNATGGDNWNNNTGWKSQGGDPCGADGAQPWFGVYCCDPAGMARWAAAIGPSAAKFPLAGCENATGDIAAIFLEENNLVGG